MDKVIGYIYETMDYDKFKRLPDNRDVYESRIGKLIASIKERYILNPITVNEKMEVIDGQGRFDARKKWSSRFITTSSRVQPAKIAGG